jgi:hypothetical protein
MGPVVKIYQLYRVSGVHVEMMMMFLCCDHRHLLPSDLTDAWPGWTTSRARPRLKMGQSGYDRGRSVHRRVEFFTLLSYER